MAPESPSFLGRKDLATDKSTFQKPGPTKAFRPRLPTSVGPGSQKAEGLSNWYPPGTGIGCARNGLWPGIRLGRFRRISVSELTPEPGQAGNIEEEITLNGNPDRNPAIPATCQ